MKLIRFFGLPIVCLISQVAFLNCAPMKARQIRAMKPVTVGLPLGVMYRPNGDFALGTGYASIVEDEVNMTTGRTEVQDGEEKQVKRKALRDFSTFKPYVHFYPWADSAFFFGLGGEFTNSRVTLEDGDELASGPIASVGSVYKVNTQSVRAPVGWSWIWESGVSLLIDLGPTLQTQQSIEAKQEVSGGEEASQKKEDVAYYEKDPVISPLLLLGYSF